jgi:flagellar export protein FliJ
MAFRFKLDAVLRFREGVEHTEEAALYRIVREIADAEAELQQIKTNQDRLREQREQELTLKLPAVHLLEIADRELDLKNAAEALRLRLQQLETQRVKQLAIYQSAHQDREVLSELCDRQRQAHGLEQRRQEQKTLDDLFLARSKPGK